LRLIWSTIAAPVTPVSRRQRWTKTYPLALLYRLLGPNRLFTKILFDVLLGSEAIAAHPDWAAEMVSAFRAADRESIRRTIRFMHSWRPLTDKLPAVTVPTLLITGDLGDQLTPKSPPQRCPTREQWPSPAPDTSDHCCSTSIKSQEPSSNSGNRCHNVQRHWGRGMLKVSPNVRIIH
jgi:pimeloyl-ACP methyl ester carboxylesterase